MFSYLSLDKVVRTIEKSFKLEISSEEFFLKAIVTIG